MQRETIHKAVAAFISSVLTILVTIGVVIPEWLMADATVQNISWLVATVISLIGGGIITGAVYATDNKSRSPGEGPLGG